VVALQTRIAGSDLLDLTIDGTPVKGHLVLARFLSDGTLVWAKGYEVDNPIGLPTLRGYLAVTDDVDIAFGGNLNGFVDFGGGPLGVAASDSYELRPVVARIDGLTGALVWATLFDGPESWLNDVGVGPTGEIL